MNKISGRIITIFCSVCCAFFIVSCGQGCNNVSTSVSDTQTAIRKELSPEEKYSFLFEKGAPPLPDTPAEFLPRLPDIVVAPDLYQKKATFFTRLPFGGLTLSGEGEELGDYSCAINEKNYIVLLEEMGSVLVVISPEGKYLYEMPSRESTVFVRDSKGNIMGVSDDNPDQDIFLGIEGPIVFISDSVCVFQIGYFQITPPKPDNEGRFQDWGFAETVVAVNIYTRKIVSERSFSQEILKLIQELQPAGTPEGIDELERHFPDWHPEKLKRKLESGEAEYPPMKWRTGNISLADVVDPVAGRGYAAIATRKLGETIPSRILVQQLFAKGSVAITDPDSYGNQKYRDEYPFMSTPFLESKIDRKRYYILRVLSPPVCGQTEDGRVFFFDVDTVIGFSKIGDEIVMVEKYDPPSFSSELWLDDDEKIPNKNLGDLIEVMASPSGRVVWLYRTPRGIEIFKAERPKKVERRRSR